jgi:hypothetical protein
MLAVLGLISFTAQAVSEGSKASAYVPSKSAAARCDAKVKMLESFADSHKPGQSQTTQFTEDEINSYLALAASAKYHPCLKSLIVAFRENKMKATAAIDFDRLGSSSTKLLPKLMGLLFSGTHTLAADGQLISKDGKGNFKLEQATFDGGTLPGSLVEEIMSAVGRKQSPPFDPMQPSALPYEIRKVDVHSGYIIVYQ